MSAESLYELQDSVDVPLGLRLVAGLNGFTDAGGSISQTSEHIFQNLSHRMVLRFDNDQLLDYRSRRPVMFFEKDHISSYTPPLLALYLVEDEAGQPFLYLHGYEPDFAWEKFAKAVGEIANRYAVSDFVWVHSIPFPAPHSKPLSVTVSGNRSDLIAKYSEWKPETQVPGNVLHLLEFTLSAIGYSTAGFVLLVPHYISESDYPKTAVTAFELITAATGLVFPTDTLREQNEKFERKLEQQIAENADLQRMVENLEQGWKNQHARIGDAPVRSPEVEIPSADDIAAQLEDYLSSRQRNEEDN